MKRIVGEAHDEAVQLLGENRERLEALADALFRAETLDGTAAYAAAGVRVPAEEEAPGEDGAPSGPAAKDGGSDAKAAA